MIVDKEWLTNKIREDKNRTVGRALLAIYNNQTSEEKRSGRAVLKNKVGFSKPDSRLYSKGAYEYKNFGHVSEWIVDIAIKPARDGYPAICKYANQLNEIAKTKQQNQCLKDASTATLGMLTA